MFIDTIKSLLDIFFHPQEMNAVLPQNKRNFAILYKYLSVFSSLVCFYTSYSLVRIWTEDFSIALSLGMLSGVFRLTIYYWGIPYITEWIVDGFNKKASIESIKAASSFVIFGVFLKELARVIFHTLKFSALVIEPMYVILSFIILYMFILTVGALSYFLDIKSKGACFLVVNVLCIVSALVFIWFSIIASSSFLGFIFPY